MQVRTCIKEASGSAKLSGHSKYGMPPCHKDYRSRCHPGEGKKWVRESEQCIQQPVCTTTGMGTLDSNTGPGA
eukprot:10176535-Ditylum_brightwellii.AAC.1